MNGRRPLKRRAIVAGAIALLPLRVKAGIEDFPLAPRPNPNTTCAPPLYRNREPVAAKLITDILTWQYEHPHVDKAYVMVHESMIAQVPSDGFIRVNGTLFTFTVMAQSGMPEDALWGILADCGTLL
jgi:hypothetical protein